MWEKIKNILSALKRPRYIILILAVGLIGWGIISVITKKDPSLANLFTVAKGEISQEVSVTGRVKPAQNVDLAFEKSGRVASVAAHIGDKVNAGQVLASLSNSDLAAQLEQAKASLQKEQIKLEQLKAGTREEDLQISRTAVANAQKSLTDAQSKATTDLNNIYDGVREVLTGAYASADDAINKQSADLFSNRAVDPQLTFYTDTQSDINARAGMTNAQKSLNQIASTINSLGSGQNEMDAALIAVNSQMKIIQSALNSFSEALNNAANLTSTTLASYKYNVNLGRTNVNAAITSINTKQQSIVAQRATNQNSITTAQNALAAAQDQLNLKLAGNSAQDIASQEAQVRYAQANVDSYAAQLSKTVIHSPLAGIITKQDAKVGQIINANTTLISVISAAQFEIEANIPEADIAKVKIGDNASITLDTYGNSVIFEAKVVKIDPAETMIEGVATYKTSFQFSQNDERIKSGMTANIDILTAKKSDVLVIPQRAIIQRNGEQFVQLFSASGVMQEKQIVGGLKGSDGNVEIISGLNEGDKILSIGSAGK